MYEGNISTELQQVTGQDRMTVCDRLVNDTSLVKCKNIYTVYIKDETVIMYACVFDVNRVSIHSGLSFPALETETLLWIFKEPIYY